MEYLYVYLIIFPFIAFALVVWTLKVEKSSLTLKELISVVFLCVCPLLNLIVAVGVLGEVLVNQGWWDRTILDFRDKQ